MSYCLTPSELNFTRKMSSDPELELLSSPPAVYPVTQMLSEESTVTPNPQSSEDVPNNLVHSFLQLNHTSQGRYQNSPSQRYCLVLPRFFPSRRCCLKNPPSLHSHLHLKRFPTVQSTVLKYSTKSAFRLNLGMISCSEYCNSVCRFALIVSASSSVSLLVALILLLVPLYRYRFKKSYCLCPLRQMSRQRLILAT